MTSFEPTGCNPEGNEDGGTGDRGDGCRNNEARVEGIIKKEEQKSVKSLKSGVEKEREGRKEGLTEYYWDGNACRFRSRYLWQFNSSAEC